MSNMVEVNDYVTLSEVAVGSWIDVEDNERKVVKNLGIDLLLETDGPFPTSYKALVEEFKDEWAGSNEQVYVHEAPTVVRTQLASGSLKSTIEARFSSKPALSGQEKFKQELDAKFGKTPSPAPVVTPTVNVVDPTAKLRQELSTVASQANSAQKAANAVNNRVDDAQRAFDRRIEAVTSDVSSLRAKLEHQSIQSKINSDLANQTNEAKSQGGNTMTNTFKNLLGGFTNSFGKVANQFALSPAGLAVKAEPKNPFSTWVAYDKATGTLTDVQNLVFSTDVPAFQLPVNPGQVKTGDIISNNGDYQYVVEVFDDYVKTICPAKKSFSTVLPVKNLMLGQAFYITVKTLDLAGQAGFNPALLLAMGKGDKSELLPFLLMSGGLGGDAAGQLDPMMLMALSDGADDILPFILMQQGGVTPQGFNPLMLLAMGGGDKGGKFKDLLPMLLMSQGANGAGGAAGLQGMLPFLLMGDKGGDGLKDILMMQAFAGQGGANPFGNLFGGAPAAPAAVDTTKDKGKSKE